MLVDLSNNQYVAIRDNNLCSILYTQDTCRCSPMSVTEGHPDTLAYSCLETVHCS